MIKDNGLKDDDGMKRTIAVVSMTLALGLTACEGSSDAAPSAGRGVTASAPTATAPDPIERAQLAPAELVFPGAPAFAALYPGAVVEGDPTIADGVAGPGGLLTFSTEAEPGAVVDFYKRRAEASGLSPVMAMNQGEAIAYGAGSAEGATIQVVASPSEDGGTSVQLSWSAGE